LEPNSAFPQSTVALGLSGRYATALFDLAVKAKSLDAVAASLGVLKDALGESADLKTLITSPMVTRTAAAAGIKGVAESLGLDSLTSNFLGVLAANRRLAALPVIIRDFNALAAARRGEITAQVTSAHALSAVQQKALSARLKAGLGRDVALDITVDPAILGGLIVRVGSRMIDSSLKTRLGALGQALKG
jgi:F-type H+-transporting ATPase subunit delta